MESRFTKPLQTCFPPLNSVDSSKTLPSSSPDNTGNLSDELSSGSDSSVPDSELSDYELLLEKNEVDDTDIEDKERCDFSPPKRFSSHWSQPWSNINDRKRTELPLSVPATEDIKASFSDRWLPPYSNVKPYFMPLLAEFKPPIVGAGLENLGNTCFLNAVMQCFTHTVPLLMGLISSKHRFPCHASMFRRLCVLCVLLDHVNDSLRCMGKLVTPLTLVTNLKYFSSSFCYSQQEDAHEFLQCFLDKLENSWNDVYLDHAFSSRSNIVTQVFGGRLVSTLRCCNCGYCSDTYEPSIDLSLEIEDTNTLHGALDSFTKVEKIEDSEMKFTCQKCEERVSVEKQLMLDRIPAVAVFHLKRFKSDGLSVEKIDKHVAFPLELDMRSYTAGCQSAELIYNLYAVVVHNGYSSNSGHYYCFIRSAPRMWYKFDDEQVSWVDEELVLSQEAYILFYAKQGVPCFASFIEAHRNSMYIPIINTSPNSVFDNVDPSTSSSSLPSECQTDGHETNDAANEASTVTNEKPECSRINECENEENGVPDLTPLIATNLTNDMMPTRSRPRSMSPDIHREDSPDQIFSSPRGDIRSEDKVTGGDLRPEEDKVSGGDLGSEEDKVSGGDLRSEEDKVGGGDLGSEEDKVGGGDLGSEEDKVSGGDLGFEEDKVSCKSQQKDEIEDDLERKQALSMTETRWLKFSPAKGRSNSEGSSSTASKRRGTMGRSHSEGFSSVNKRGRGMHLFVNVHQYPKNSRHKGI